MRKCCENPEGKKNFLVVDSKVHIKDIEEQFHDKGGTIHAGLETEGLLVVECCGHPKKEN